MYTAPNFFDIRQWKSLSFGQFDLPTYAHCTGSESGHAIASDIAQQFTQRAHIIYTNA